MTQLAIEESMEELIALVPLNTMRSRQNGHHLSDDIFRYMNEFLNENV